jgi:predicted DNA-binding transcriptional regulator AlpA
MPDNDNMLSMVDAQAVARSLGIGIRTLRRLIAKDIFPRPDLSIGNKIRRWRPETVDAWVRNRSRSGDR